MSEAERKPLGIAYAIKRKNEGKPYSFSGEKKPVAPVTSNIMKSSDIARMVLEKRKSLQPKIEDLSDEAFMAEDIADEEEDLLAIEDEATTIPRKDAIRSILEGLKRRR